MAGEIVEAVSQGRL
ncbi:hypothetical protein ACU4HD_08355 [Cupriavidus basilensis]